MRQVDGDLVGMLGRPELELPRVPAEQPTKSLQSLLDYLDKSGDWIFWGKRHAPSPTVTQTRLRPGPTLFRAPAGQAAGSLRTV